MKKSPQVFIKCVFSFIIIWKAYVNVVFTDMNLTPFGITCSIIGSSVIRSSVVRMRSVLSVAPFSSGTSVSALLSVQALQDIEGRL